MTFRSATADDAVALRDLEEAANLAALGHVFPAAEFSFPGQEVLDRWRVVLASADVTTEVADGETGLVCFAAYDATTLRHLAVHPDRWGTGLARAAVALATAAIEATGARPRLWCLAANDRALGLYTHLGWRPTGRDRPAEWPPYPTEQELVLGDWKA